MANFERATDSSFALSDFRFTPRYHHWRGLRMHYVDEGPRQAPVMLLLHGMPTWSYLYRDIIPTLVAAGYRCVAPDHLGFGRSDKPTDLNFYSTARHVEILASLIAALNLTRMTLVCQDWGGPIGLAQAATMPDRFEQLVIMNTWLHHAEYEYSEGIRNWNKNWHEGGLFHRERPNVALLMLLSANLLPRQTVFPALVAGTEPQGLAPEAERMYRGYRAPTEGLSDAAYNGYRMFPLSIPLTEDRLGAGQMQALHYRTLLALKQPAHFIWGGADDVFTESWGRRWAEQMDAGFDLIPEAGHFLQNTHGATVAERIVRRFGAA